MGVLGVIPARYGASRFPGKPLANLGGQPLVVRVWQRCREASCFQRILVATDHPDIARVVTEAGGEVRMTPSELPSGSDRVAHVVRELESEGDRFGIVVNIQGDEPFLPGQAMEGAVQVLQEVAEADIATLAVPLDEEERTDPHAVKVWIGARGEARDFAREQGARGAPEWKHVGLYAFRTGYLKRFVALPVSPREHAERLEQLRALEDGAHIQVVTGTWPVWGVDTPEDLRRAETRLLGP